MADDDTWAVAKAQILSLQCVLVVGLWYNHFFVNAEQDDERPRRGRAFRAARRRAARRRLFVVYR